MYPVKGEVLNLLCNYLDECYQRLVLNLQFGSVPGTLMFLIYINHLPGNIQSTCKIFADGTSPFLHVSDKSTSQSELNKDLQAISN